LLKDPAAQLSLVGDRKSIYESLSVEDRQFVDASQSITFTGYIGRNELYELLSSARALVTFSELESFFMVGIEAMSVGCPVIGANNSSIEESLGSAGLLFPPGELDEAVEMALRVQQPEFREELEHSCRSWASRFDAKTCAADFVKYVEHRISKLKKTTNL
jgi:glycosyltransferase involved in cell wall biosynthesis